MRPLGFRRRVLLFALPVLLLTAGCTASPPRETVVQPQISGAYTVGASLVFGDAQTAEMTLTRCGKGSWDAEFSEPASLSGVVLSLEGNAVSANYKGLAFTVPKSAMPAKAMLCILTDVLDSLDTPDGISCAKLEDGRLVCTGDAEAGSYTVSFTEAGILSGFEMPSQPLRAEFRDYHAGAVAGTAQQSGTEQTELTSPNTDSTQSGSTGTEAAAKTGTAAKNEGVSQ